MSQVMFGFLVVLGLCQVILGAALLVRQQAGPACVALGFGSVTLTLLFFLTTHVLVR